MGIHTTTIVMATEQSKAIARRPKKPRSPPREDPIVLEEMPFISFEQPGQDSDGEKQKIIRKHLGRRRKKMAPQRSLSDSSNKIVKATKQHDTFTSLCICYSDVTEFLQAAVNDGRSMVLELCSECGRPRLVESTSSIASSLVSSPMAGPICDNSVDPFAMLPIQSSSNMHNLIKHFFEFTAPATIPIPELAPLFPNIAAATSLMAHDETLLQSVLSLTSMHLEHLKGARSPSAASLEERGKAIALLNRNLTNPSDGLIISVTIMASCEMVAGNFESWRAHMFGLRNLLGLRGGLTKQDLVRDAVFEVDSVGSVIFSVQPHLADFLDMEDISEDRCQANLPYEFISIDPHLRQTFAAMRSLCTILDSYLIPRRKRGLDKAALLDFAERRSVIEYRLLTTSIEEDAEADEDLNSSSTATNVLLIAAKIFNYLVFRKMLPSSYIHTNLAVRLREAILAFDHHASSRHATCLLLWAAVMGCLAMRQGPLRLWFLGWVSHCALELDLCELADLEYQLGKVMWIDGILGASCQSLWSELEGLQKMGVEVKFAGEIEG